MENRCTPAMEEFLQKGNDTLEAGKKATRFNQWLFAGILGIALVILVDTRIEVVKKADASDIQKEYVTKIDAMSVHKLEKAHTDKTIQTASGSGGISGTGKHISSLLICQIYLSATPTNVNAYQFDIHYEKDMEGSRTTTSK